MGNTESNVTSGVKKQAGTSTQKLYKLVDIKGKYNKYFFSKRSKCNKAEKSDSSQRNELSLRLWPPSVADVLSDLRRSDPWRWDPWLVGIYVTLLQSVIIGFY